MTSIVTTTPGATPHAKIICAQLNDGGREDATTVNTACRIAWKHMDGPARQRRETSVTTMTCVDEQGRTMRARAPTEARGGDSINPWTVYWEKGGMLHVGDSGT